MAPWISAAIAVALTITAIWLGSDATGLTALVLGVVAGARARSLAARLEAENARLREGIESMMRGPARWVRKVRLVEPEWREATNE